MGKWKVVLPLVIVGLILSACPVKNIPEIGEAETAIAAAEDAGAAQYAPTKLNAAKEALEASKAARQSRSYNEAVAQAELARRLANEARAEALAALENPARDPDPPAIIVGAVDYSKIFKSVFFDFDRHNVKFKYRSSLDGAAEFMKDHRSVKVTIFGHCDPRGTDDYNLALGERRANSVEQYLVNSGVSSRRISSITKGESDLLDPTCGSEECWWEERRAVFEVND